METTYITLTAREILVEGAAVQRVSGGGTRQLVCVRKAARPESAPAGKVIDMAAWKAEREEICEEEFRGEVEEECFEPVRESVSPKAGRKSALTLDLWASVGMIGVVTVLLVRVLFGA